MGLVAAMAADRWMAPVADATLRPRVLASQVTCADPASRALPPPPPTRHWPPPPSPQPAASSLYSSRVYGPRPEASHPIITPSGSLAPAISPPRQLASLTASSAAASGGSPLSANREVAVKEPPQYIRQTSSTCDAAVLEWVPKVVVSADGFQDEVCMCMPLL